MYSLSPLSLSLPLFHPAFLFLKMILPSDRPLSCGQVRLASFEVLVGTAGHLLLPLLAYICVECTRILLAPPKGCWEHNRLPVLLLAWIITANETFKVF